jgi:hypothetical protein
MGKSQGLALNAGGFVTTEFEQVALDGSDHI